MYLLTFTKETSLPKLHLWCGGSRNTKFYMVDIKFVVSCGELNLYFNTTNCQKIMNRITDNPKQINSEIPKKHNGNFIGVFERFLKISC